MSPQVSRIRSFFIFLLLIAILSILNIINYRSYREYTKLRSRDIQARTGEMADITADPHTWKGLERSILNILGNESSKYGILVKDLETGGTLSINGNKSFPPASIYKVPLSIVVLSDVDRGRTSLDSRYLVTNKEKVYPNDSLSLKKGNYTLSLRTLIEYNIAFSDNTAMTTLEHRFGGVYHLQRRLKNEFNIDVTRLPLRATPNEVGEVYEGLYNQRYLKQQTNDLLLSYMKNTKPWFHDRIPAGLPKNTVYAHKVGNLNNVHADAAIVYGENPYILVIMNEGVSRQTATAKSQKITKSVHAFMNPTTRQ